MRQQRDSLLNAIQFRVFGFRLSVPTPRTLRLMTLAGSFWHKSISDEPKFSTELDRHGTPWLNFNKVLKSSEQIWFVWTTGRSQVFPRGQKNKHFEALRYAQHMHHIRTSRIFYCLQMCRKRKLVIMVSGSSCEHAQLGSLSYIVQQLALQSIFLLSSNGKCSWQSVCSCL